MMRSQNGRMCRPGELTTRILTPSQENLDSDPAILEGAAFLRAGKLVAFPTETVYGLGANAFSPEAVDEIFAVKERPADNPLIVHVASISDVAQVGRVADPRLEKLLARFWPGPLTVIIPARESTRSSVCRGMETVAVRMPDHSVALALIRVAGFPVAAPSANLSGRPSPTMAQHVRDDLGGRIPLIIDGGPCRLGIESTVLDLSGKNCMILRPGAITGQEIAAELGIMPSPARGNALSRSPGTRYRHYSPRSPVIVIGPAVTWSGRNQLLRTTKLWLGPRAPLGYIATRSSDLVTNECLEVRDRRAYGTLSQRLYSDLRELDASGVKAIFIEALANEEPVTDRVLRAASIVVKDDPAADRLTIDQLDTGDAA